MSFWLVVAQVWKVINSCAVWNSYKPVKKTFCCTLTRWPFSPLTHPCLSFSPFRKKKKKKHWLAHPPHFCCVFLLFFGWFDHPAACNYSELLCRNEYGGAERKSGEKMQSSVHAFLSRLASSFCRCRDSSQASSLEATSGNASKQKPMLLDRSWTRTFLERRLFCLSWNLSCAGDCRMRPSLREIHGEVG